MMIVILFTLDKKRREFSLGLASSSSSNPPSLHDVVVVVVVVVQI